MKALTMPAINRSARKIGISVVRPIAARQQVLIASDPRSQDRREPGRRIAARSAQWQATQAGQAQEYMATVLASMGPEKVYDLFSKWTDRIAGGELPFDKPDRPKGIERNVVFTMWDWAAPTRYQHDAISTDKRNPRVNANGLIYGSSEESSDLVPTLDPVKNIAGTIKHPFLDPKTASSTDAPRGPSAYWGDEAIWDSQTSPHNPMFDEKGRVWFTSRVRGPDNLSFCRAGSDHPSARIFPLERSNRQLSMYDPTSGKFTLVDTCFGTHHLYFAEDANNTLWASSGGAANPVVGWLNRKMLEETGDERKAQGWTAFILDTNGNGKRDDYVGPNDPVDPKKDKRIVAGFYGLAPSPVDGSVWGSVLGYPGSIIRVNPGSNPPETALTEVFEPPLPGYSPRGMDIDRKGVVWAPLASGHLASFDPQAVQMTVGSRTQNAGRRFTPLRFAPTVC